mmetsp:Transcript_15124/g.42995  ORF Transcript_15124/g.42995 Transcript_15124/m.42995 type:complete len:501 (-) Transcript_15124:487-1989(-)
MTHGHDCISRIPQFGLQNRQRSMANGGIVIRQNHARCSFLNARLCVGRAPIHSRRLDMHVLVDHRVFVFIALLPSPSIAGAVLEVLPRDKSPEERNALSRALCIKARDAFPGELLGSGRTTRPVLQFLLQILVPCPPLLQLSDTKPQPLRAPQQTPLCLLLLRVPRVQTQHCSIFGRWHARARRALRLEHDPLGRGLVQEPASGRLPVALTIIVTAIPRFARLIILRRIERRSCLQLWQVAPFCTNQSVPFSSLGLRGLDPTELLKIEIALLEQSQLLKRTPPVDLAVEKLLHPRAEYHQRLLVDPTPFLVVQHGVVEHQLKVPHYLLPGHILQALDLRANRIKAHRILDDRKIIWRIFLSDGPLKPAVPVQIRHFINDVSQRRYHPGHLCNHRGPRLLALHLQAVARTLVPVVRMVRVLHVVSIVGVGIGDVTVRRLAARARLVIRHPGLLRIRLRRLSHRRLAQAGRRTHALHTLLATRPIPRASLVYHHRTHPSHTL